MVVGVWVGARGVSLAERQEVKIKTSGLHELIKNENERKKKACRYCQVGHVEGTDAVGVADVHKQHGDRWEGGERKHENTKRTNKIIR